MKDLQEISDYYIEHFNRGYVREFLREEPFTTRMTILLGQRGVGKTTVIIQYLVEEKEKGERVLYIPVDHILMGGRSLYEVAEVYYKEGGRLICFDEIHKYESWSMELKSICDTFGELKVIASGSSALEIHKGSHDLSRRAIVREMRGLSFREYLALKLEKSFGVVTLNEIITKHRELGESIVEEVGSGVILEHFQRYLRTGYYPYFLEYKRDEDFYNALEQSVHASIEGDLQAVYPNLTGATIAKIRRLMAFIAKQVPFEPTLSKLVTALELSDQRVLKTYLKYLEDAGLINMLSKSGNRLSGLEKPQKIYLNNSNQAYAFGKESTNTGNVRETFFFNTTKAGHDVSFPAQGDFNVNGVVFEVGGKSKTIDQIRNVQSAFLAVDGMEIGYENVVPLWLFGFLY